MAMVGDKGHIAMMDSLRMTLSAELYVNETARDVVFLHNEASW